VRQHSTGTAKPNVFALPAATSVCRSTFFEPIIPTRGGVDLGALDERAQMVAPVATAFGRHAPGRRSNKGSIGYQRIAPAVCVQTLTHPQSTSADRVQSARNRDTANRISRPPAVSSIALVP
jgi:hypothetical protein